MALNNVERTAWLALVAPDDQRIHAGNDGYDDVPEAHYSWDSSVPNHARVSRGDLLVLWDAGGLLGASVIEDIDCIESTKQVYRCPKCHSARIKTRESLEPRYRCNECKETFDQRVSESKQVTAYRSKHDLGWVDLAGRMRADQLRRFAVKPQSQNSFRELRWRAFVDAIHLDDPTASFRVVDAAAYLLTGGHRQAAVRVREGQAAFRRELLDQFGPVCAFTGRGPVEALEAAHLYSYAAIGRHDRLGGLLLRRDLHRLFDLGHIAVRPQDEVIDVAPTLSVYPEYSRLHGNGLAVTLEDGHRKWLYEHWTEHRSSGPLSLTMG